MKSSKKSFLRKLWIKEPWENIASAVIIVGAFMLLQPYSIDLYKFMLLVYKKLDDFVMQIQTSYKIIENYQDDKFGYD